MGSSAVVGYDEGHGSGTVLRRLAGVSEVANGLLGGVRRLLDSSLSLVRSLILLSILVAKSITWLSEGLSSLSASSSFMLLARPLTKIACNAESPQPLSAANIRNWIAYFETESVPCCKSSNCPTA